MGDSLISENKWEISENRSRTGNEFFLQSFQRQTVNRIRLMIDSKHFEKTFSNILFGPFLHRSEVSKVEIRREITG